MPNTVAPNAAELPLTNARRFTLERSLRLSMALPPIWPFAGHAQCAQMACPSFMDQETNTGRFQGVSRESRRVLEIDGLQTHFFTTVGTVRAVDGVSYSLETRRDAGRGRRIRGAARACRRSPSCAWWPIRRAASSAAQIRFQGRNLLELSETEMERVRGNEISMIFQEPMTSLNPLYTVGGQIAEAVALHQGLSRKEALEPRCRDAATGLHPRAGEARARLSAPAFGRHAPARDDRHGALLQSQGADRRRADHRARRHHPGADPRPDARAAGDDRHGDHPDHPRHGRGGRERRPRGGDVCRPQGRGGAGRRAVRPARPSLHRGPAGLDPASRRGGAQRRPARAPERDQGHGAVAVQPAAGLQLRAALRQGDRPMPRGRAAARGASARPLHRLLERRHERALLEVPFSR